MFLKIKRAGAENRKENREESRFRTRDLASFDHALVLPRPERDSLTAMVPSNLLATITPDQVSVSNPAPGGGSSTSFEFTVPCRIPTLLFPKRKPAGLWI